MALSADGLPALSLSSTRTVHINLLCVCLESYTQFTQLPKHPRLLKSLLKSRRPRPYDLDELPGEIPSPMR